MNTISFHHKVYSYFFVRSIAYVMNFIYSYINNSVHDHFIQMTWFLIQCSHTRIFLHFSNCIFMVTVHCKQGFHPFGIPSLLNLCSFSSMLVNFHFFHKLFFPVLLFLSISLLLGGWHFGRDGEKSKRLGFCQEHRGAHTRRGGARD